MNAGRQIVTMLPDDIILNTRRAFNTSVTTANGYSDLGAPEGRYFAPANGDVHPAEVRRLRPADAPRPRAVFHAHRHEPVEEVPRRGHNNFELSLDMLNVFDNINFNPATCPSSGTTLCQVTSAYTTPVTRSIPAAGSGRLSSDSTGNNRRGKDSIDGVTCRVVGATHASPLRFFVSPDPTVSCHCLTKKTPPPPLVATGVTVQPACLWVEATVRPAMIPITVPKATSLTQ